MYKAVFLDIDNTLLDFAACARYAMRAALPEFGSAYEDSLFPLFTRINNSLWEQLERGELTQQQLYDTRWSLIFSQWRRTAAGDIAAGGIDGVAFERRFSHFLAYSAEPVDGARELLAALRGRTLVCAASNGPYEQQRFRLESAGLLPYFDRLFVSEALGVSKPEAAFFDACFADLPPMERKDALMVGDSLTADILGGLRAGMDTCWFSPAGKADDGGIRPAHTVRTLAGVLQLPGMR